METKKCTKCGEEKPLSSFFRSINVTLRSRCRACLNAYTKARRANESPDKKAHRLRGERERARIHRENMSPEKKAARAAKTKQYRIDKKDKIQENLIKTRPRRLESMKEWRKKRATHVSDYQKEYRSKPEKKALRCALQQKREALKKDAVLPDTNFKIIEQLYQARRILSEETGIPHAVDHIIPISIGGAHHQDNLEVITKEENGKKSDQWNPKEYPNQLTARWADNELASKTKKELGIE